MRRIRFGSLLLVGLCLGLTALAQQRPVVTLSADRTSGLAPMQVHLVARGSPPSATNLSSARYSWDFGDRTVGQGANATHTYKDAGTYRVSVVYTRFVQGPEEQQYATNIVTLTVTNKPQIDVKPRLPAVLVVNPGEINLIWQAGSLPKGVFRIANKGGLSLKWTIISHPSWIGIYPSSGAIDVGKEVSVEARAAGSVPKAGIYSGPIMISSAGAINSPATVKVMLVVAAKPKPGWLWPVVGVVVVVVAGTVVLLRPKKAKRKDTPPKADVAVHPTKDAGVQKIKTKPPIVKFCLGINIVVGEGVFRVRKNQKIIASVKRKEG